MKWLYKLVVGLLTVYCTRVTMNNLGESGLNYNYYCRLRTLIIVIIITASG